AWRQVLHRLFLPRSSPDERSDTSTSTTEPDAIQERTASSAPLDRPETLAEPPSLHRRAQGRS
ncbi:MAG: hypothetical protein AAFQ75_12940, partial [Pseudomonadota bacterium]